jgi:uncharacterized protein YjbJ (UPF0337 family)
MILCDTRNIRHRETGRRLLDGLCYGGRDMSGEQDQSAGSAKEFEGKITGDKERESEGEVQHAAGNVEKAAGDAADKVRGAAAAATDKTSGQ